MRFRLIHRQTRLTLGEHKSRHPLRYYFVDGLVEDLEFQQIPIRAIIRCDGAVGFQRLNARYDDGQIYFLNRDEWEVVMTTENGK